MSAVRFCPEPYFYKYGDCGEVLTHRLWFRHSWVRFPSVAPYKFLLRGCSLVVKPHFQADDVGSTRSPAPLLFHSSSVVELSAVNRSVVGSNPTCGAIRPLGQAVKTPPFHGGNTGSSPVGHIIRGEISLLDFMWRVVRVGRRSTPESV